jgi:ATP-binding cassette, subfamily F, member 3
MPPSTRLPGLESADSHIHLALPILTCTNVAHRYGEDIILDGVSLSIEPGERVGVVGRNGTGKSTLLKILGGVLKHDQGIVSLQRGMKAGYLQQDPVFDPNETLRDAAEAAFERLHALHLELNNVFEDMAHAQGTDLDRLLEKQVKLETEITAAGGYAVDHKIDEVLHGVGFTDAQFGQKVGSLSGGQRGKLALAQLLLESPDVLLLDEPTNHLDIEARQWLESFLVNEFRGAVLLISHDRYLLDNVVNRIIETEQGRLIDYPGNYEKFRELRVERRTVMMRAFEAQQDRFRKEEAYIRRYKAGQRARQAKGRETRLEREKTAKTLERPMELDVFALRLPESPRCSDSVVSGRGLSKAYKASDGSSKVLFRDLDISITRGERVGIIGPNGAGKTTLVRCLLGELPVDSGMIRLGSNVIPGYYRQTHVGLDMSLPVWRYLQGVILKEVPGKAWSEQQARDLAGAFLFSGSEQEKELGVLSGGERSRAVLAGLLASAKNLLVLDEPTNHLDIDSAERLEDALSLEGGYDGTLILISHDRALIDAVCDQMIILDGHGGAEVFPGGFTLWHEKDVKRKREQANAAAQEKARAEEAAKRKAAAAVQTPTKSRPQSNPANKLERLTTQELEQRIEKIETRLREVDRLLAEPDTWRDHAKMNQLGSERTKLINDKEPLEFEWSRRADQF